MKKSFTKIQMVVGNDMSEITLNLGRVTLLDKGQMKKMKILVFIWLITLFMDNLLPLMLARFYPNYEHKEMALSVLGSRQSPVKWIYNVWAYYPELFFALLRMYYTKKIVVD